MPSEIAHVTQESFDRSIRAVIGEAAVNYTCEEVFNKEQHKKAERKIALPYHHYLKKP